MNGTRTVSRQKEAVKFTGFNSIRISVTDNITASDEEFGCLKTINYR